MELMETVRSWAAAGAGQGAQGLTGAGDTVAPGCGDDGREGDWGLETACSSWLVSPQMVPPVCLSGRVCSNHKGLSSAQGP